jgi:hypothetical protein
VRWSKIGSYLTALHLLVNDRSTETRKAIVWGLHLPTGPISISPIDESSDAVTMKLGKNVYEMISSTS